MRKILFSIISVMLLFNACIEETDTIVEKPKITLMKPQPCDTLYYGRDFNLQIRIVDNTGLGNISMDVHNNFGHHSHGDHETCNMDAPKEAIAPYSDEWIFSLPMDSLDYIFDTLLTIPDKKNDTTSFDTGDYHFHIYVTDNDGYQTFTTMDMKIL